jgi:hypothetical protein
MKENKNEQLIEAFFTRLPGDGVLPRHWRYGSLNTFLRKYAALGICVWAKAPSSCTLFINGQWVLRIWKDLRKSVMVDSASHLLHPLPVEAIPERNARKSKPFTVRSRIRSEEEMAALADRVKQIYGLGA